MTYFNHIHNMTDDQKWDVAREAKANAVMLIRTVAPDSETSIYATVDRLTPPELAMVAIALAGFLDGLSEIVVKDKEVWYDLLMAYMIHEKDDDNG